jgi:hypothetical protein
LIGDETHDECLSQFKPREKPWYPVDRKKVPDVMTKNKNAGHHFPD